MKQHLLLHLESQSSDKLKWISVAMIGWGYCQYLHIGLLLLAQAVALTPILFCCRTTRRRCVRLLYRRPAEPRTLYERSLTSAFLPGRLCCLCGERVLGCVKGAHLT